MKDTGGGYSCDHCRRMIDRQRDPTFLSITFRVNDLDPQQTEFHFHSFCLRRIIDPRRTEDGRMEHSLDQPLFFAIRNVMGGGDPQTPV